MTNPIDEALRLGGEAEYILNSDAFQRSMKEIEDELIDAWSRDNNDAKTREDLYYRVQGARSFFSRLTSLLDSKRVAKDQIERAHKRAERAA